MKPVAQPGAEINRALWLSGHPDGKRPAPLPLRSPFALWTKDPVRWDGQGVSVLLLSGATQDERRRALRELAARVPDGEGAEVSVLHRAGRGPMLMRNGTEMRRPALSSASRGGLAAVAVGSAALGVDLEVVAASGEIPWAVLADDEAAALRRLPEPDRPAWFARVWSVKEAYLKALRVGLSHDPAEVSVREAAAGRWVVVDWRMAPTAQPAETWWLHQGRQVAAVSLVVLPEGVVGEARARPETRRGNST